MDRDGGLVRRHREFFRSIGPGGVTASIRRAREWYGNCWCGRARQDRPAARGKPDQERLSRTGLSPQRDDRFPEYRWHCRALARRDWPGGRDRLLLLAIRASAR